MLKYFKNLKCEGKNQNIVFYYYECDPFKVEECIFKFQVFWKYKPLYKKNKFIINNLDNIVNDKDPILRNDLIINKKLFTDINLIYPITINKLVYIYSLDSLLQIINLDCFEVITNTQIKIDDVININKICKILNLKYDNRYDSSYNSDEILFFNKIEALQKFDILGTYFPVDLYDNINQKNKVKIYYELNLMWNAFCKDNKISEIELYKTKIIWKKSNDSEIDKFLLDKINFLINDNFDNNLKKMISYVIIGAFSYVDSNIKKIYSNYDFI